MLQSTSLVLLVKGQNSQFDQLMPIIQDTGLSCHMVEDSGAALTFLEEQFPVLALIDLLIDSRDATDMLVEVQKRAIRKSCNFVILSERKENYVEISALNAGADDFMVKPVNKRVFASRLNAWLRLQGNKEQLLMGKLENPKLKLDREKFTAAFSNKEINLQHKEFEIMSLLVSKPKKVFSREEIKQGVWLDAQGVRHRTIDVHIRNLRSKIGSKFIKTYKGIGYCYDA